MPINILMPALSPTMEKGNLAKWLKKEGEAVKTGDVIAEIETDKATMEYEAVDDGTLAKIVVPEGTQDVPVNQLIAVLAEEGEDVKAAAAAAAKGAPATKVPAAAAGSRSEAPAKEAAKPVPSLEAAQPGKAPGPAPAAAQVPQRPRADGETERFASAQGRANRVFASPLARRLAKEAALELGRIQGSGPHGRIIARDIEAAKAGKGLITPAPTVPAPAPVPAVAAPADDRIRALFEAGSYDVVPHDNMRRVIARRLVEAKLTIPHFYLTLDCNIGKLLAAREEINSLAPKDKEGKPAYKLSVNDFVIKALALALQRVPEANVTWTESVMLKHRRSDIGVAVSLPGGLITQAVRHAETKPLSLISNEMKDFAARARMRRLKPEEYQGGSTAVSNLGMYGIKDFTAVINPPHATILAVGAGEQRPIVNEGRIEVATIMSVTLSCDHRAVDGALGAELI